LSLTTPAHCDDCPHLKAKGLSEVDSKFVKQVFYGCIRHRKFLNLFVTGFLYKNPATAQRSEQTLYTVLGYLAFFRLEELTVPVFRSFVLTGSPPPILAFLQFAFGVEDLKEWVVSEWCKIYDMGYIEDQILGTIQRMLPELTQLINEISIKATGTKAVETDAESETKDKKPRTTVPEPFNITKPKPRLVPQPEPISREIKATKIPQSVYKTDLKSIEEQNQARRQQIHEAVQGQYRCEDEFNLAIANRAAELEKIREEIEAEKMKDCTFKPHINSEYRPPTEAAEVKMTAAAILREDALIRKKQEQEYEILRQYESELRDASEFYEWQATQIAADDLAEQERVEQRKVEMQLAREQAMEMVAAMKRRNRLQAQAQQEEMAMKLHQNDLEHAADLEQKRELVKEVQEERLLPRQAEEEVLRQNHQRAEELRLEKERDMERKRLEDEHEMERKKDLIRQIRALERVSVVRPKAFDPAEPPRHGLLSEMSLAELQERYALLKDEQEREREATRLANLEEKAKRQADLSQKAGNLARIRAQAKDAAQARHAALKQKKAEEAEKAKLRREECVLKAQEKILAKKKERLAEEQRLAKELKEISVRRQFSQANVDGDRRGAGDGMPREEPDKALVEQYKKDQVEKIEALHRRQNRDRQLSEKRRVQQSFGAAMEQARCDDDIVRAETRTAAKTARGFQKTSEIQLKQTMEKSQPFAAKITKDSIVSARRHRTKRDASLTRLPPERPESGVPRRPST